ncbi:hypothetical protein [Parendozoicomonas sp. Alg238-R29]|uniref:hypothetical protein n=1 Tax=Parendozoicomonas sp. Alg238-R29 TaxID=2993446 RepID=UPI00248DB934|nr:hypothetical protein [Parendozoicomonas sp. Alg238-R29]
MEPSHTSSGAKHQHFLSDTQAQAVDPNRRYTRSLSTGTGSPQHVSSGSLLSPGSGPSSATVSSATSATASSASLHLLSPSGSHSPLSSSTASISDDLPLDRAELEKHIKQLGATISPVNYLGQSGLLTLFLVDPDMHYARKRIYKALCDKLKPAHGRWSFSGSGATAQSTLTEEEQTLKEFLELSRKYKVKRNSKTHTVDKKELREKLEIIRDEVHKKFPLFHCQPTVSKQLWDEVSAKKRAQESFAITQDTMEKNMVLLDKMLQHLVSSDGLATGEVTNPSCDTSPEFKIPDFPWDKEPGDYAVPFDARLRVDGKQIAIPDDCYKDLAASFFVRMQAAKAFALSGRSNWMKMSRETQEIIASQLQDDEDSLASDASRFDCEVQMYAGDDLPLLPVFSTSAFLKTYEDHVNRMVQEPVTSKAESTERHNRKASQVGNGLEDGERANVQSDYLASVATGQQLNFVLSQVLGLPDELLGLAAGSITQGSLNEIYLNAKTKLFPRCNVAFIPVDQTVRGQGQKNQGSIKINSWGDGQVELIGQKHYEHFRASDTEKKLYRADTYFTIRVLAVCRSEGVVVTRVEVDIDINRLLNRKEREELLNEEKNKKRIERAKAAGKLIASEAKSRSASAKKNGFNDGQNSVITDLIIKQPKTIADYFDDASEQQMLLQMIQTEYADKNDRTAAVLKAVSECQSKKAIDFGNCRPLPHYLCQFREEPGGIDLNIGENACRLIYTQDNECVVTNVKYARTQDIELKPSKLQRYKSKDNMLHITTYSSRDDLTGETVEPYMERLVEKSRISRVRRSFRHRAKQQQFKGIYISTAGREKLAKSLGIKTGNGMPLIMTQMELAILAKPLSGEWELQVQRYCKGSQLSRSDTRSVLKYAKVYYAHDPHESGTLNKRRSNSLPALAHVGVGRQRTRRSSEHWSSSQMVPLRGQYQHASDTHLARVVSKPDPLLIRSADTLEPIKSGATPKTVTSEGTGHFPFSSTGEDEVLISELMDAISEEDEASVVENYVTKVSEKVFKMEGRPYSPEMIVAFKRERKAFFISCLRSAFPGDGEKVEQYIGRYRTEIMNNQPIVYGTLV